MKILLSVKLPSLERWNVTLCNICAASDYLKDRSISLSTSYNDLDYNETLHTRNVRLLEFRLLKSLFPVSSQLYTACPRRKGQNFGRVFLMLNYTDITQNLYSKLNGYGDNGQRKVLTSCISAYCTSSAVAH